MSFIFPWRNTFAGLRKCSKPLFLFGCFWGCVPVAVSQNITNSVSLGEVAVQASRVTKRSDGVSVIPSEMQKDASSNGYDLLQRLAFPNIRVDMTDYSISAVDHRGSVQVRIDGIVADKDDMQALNPKRISRVEFVDMPGVRYGSGVSYVILIYTRRSADGFQLGVEGMQSVAKNGAYAAHATWNKGHHALKAQYGTDYQNYDGGRMEETAQYHLTDGSVYTISRNDMASYSRNFTHRPKLTYSWADSTAAVFQISLSDDFTHTPCDSARKAVYDGPHTYTALRQRTRWSHRPVADVYYYRQFSPRQSITMNAVGTYIRTRSSDSYDEGAPYAYRVDGRTGSLTSEAIYENRFSPLSLLAGANYMYKYTRNAYMGDVNRTTVMHNHRIYVFSELNGRWRAFRYTVGAGVSGTHYRQDAYDYHYWQFRPQISVAYDFCKRWQVGYDFQSVEKVSQIAMVSNVAIRTNRMEWIVGSPGLKPNRDNMHTLRLSYTSSRLQAFVQGFFKRCRHCNMAVYERTANDQFIYTQRNQKEIDALNLMGHANCWIVPQKLSMSVTGGLFRCFNFGDDYTHCYTSYFIMGSLNAYFGNFSLTAYADNGSRFLEGETKGYNGAMSSLQLALRHKDWHFSLIWQHPLLCRYKMYDSELLHRNLHKRTTYFSKDLANLVSFKVTWTFNRGRAYHAAQKSINLSDTQTGIIR